MNDYRSVRLLCLIQDLILCMIAVKLSLIVLYLSLNCSDSGSMSVPLILLTSIRFSPFARVMLRQIIIGLYRIRITPRRFQLPYALLPHEVKAYRLHDDRDNPRSRIRDKQEMQGSVMREKSVDPDDPRPDCSDYG